MRIARGNQMLIYPVIFGLRAPLHTDQSFQSRADKVIVPNKEEECHLFGCLNEQHWFENEVTINQLTWWPTCGQLVLLGVCCSASNDGGDPFAEVSLQVLPQYTIATDGVAITCITTTEKGRIFLGGRDGHLYELLYTTGTGWQRRCRKVCLTAGLGSLLSR